MDNLEENLNLIKCPRCNYCNRKYFVKKYGTCNKCNKVLDEKAYFKYRMAKKLHLVRYGQMGFYYRDDKK